MQTLPPGHRRCILIIGLLAARESCVIFTHDADFLRISASGETHEGIVYCQESSRTIGEIVAHLAFIRDCMSPDEMRGKVEHE